jgi:CRP-like cAMP-binding protein
MRRNLGFIFQAHNLFDSLSAYENVKMALQLGDCAPGEMRQRGTQEFYLIGRGGAAALTQVAGGGEHRVATLAPGDVFGEMALLTDEARNATVQALEELEVYCLSKQDFREALERSIGFKEQIRQIYFDRYPVLRKVRHGGSELISGGPGSVSIPAS